MIQPDLLRHITLSTGDTCIQFRSTILSGTIDFLRPLILAGSGPIDGTPLSLIVVRPQTKGRTINGAATLILKNAHITAAAAFLCWRDTEALATWDEAINAEEELGGQLHPLARRPAHTPWLAVALNPQNGLMEEDLMMMSEVEICLAWTLLFTQS
jgi:hypothetical protein